MHAGYLKKFIKYDPAEVPVLLPTAFWVVCGLKLLEGRLSGPEASSASLTEHEREKVLNLVKSCELEVGYAASSDKLAEFSILSTLAAVQVLLILEEPIPNHEALAQKILNSLSASGGASVTLTTDTRDDIRFLYCATACLYLLERRWTSCQIKKITSYVSGCQASEGGFGCEPGAEAHGGHTWCALATYDLLSRMGSDSVNASIEPRRWLERRGLTGRPGKTNDACYSWWIGASKACLEGSIPTVSPFIDSCENQSTGGWSDRPGNASDLFHTFFALAGLALADGRIDPATAMPKR